MGCLVDLTAFYVPLEFKIQPKVPAFKALDWYIKKMYDLKIIGQVLNQC